MDQDHKIRPWTIHMEPMLAVRNRPSAQTSLCISIGGLGIRTNTWMMEQWGRAEVFPSAQW
jgi:hypothetical protein